MTPPTLHELAGIFMLALVTAILLPHSSHGSHVEPMRMETLIGDIAAPIAIDGIVEVTLHGQTPALERPSAGSIAN